jgi:purine-binding chemotaxis protein CheW
MARDLPFATEATYHLSRRGAVRGAPFQRELLAFRLGEEEYAVDILRIREIIKTRPVTEVPRAPWFVLGVISVRGQVLPVVDLRRRLRLPERALGRAARVLIVTRGDDLLGLLVDEVRQVVRMRDVDIEPTPSLIGGPEAGELIAGIGRPVPDRLLVLLHLDAVLSFGGRA